MIFDGGVNCARVRVRSHDATDVSHFRSVGKLLNLPPVLATVFGNLNQTIVGADVDQSFFLWRFGERGGIAEESSGLILRHCVHAPNLAHHRQLVAIETARKLAADDLPTVTAIVAAKQSIGSEIDARVRVRTDDERRVPIPSQRIYVAANFGLNPE